MKIRRSKGIPAITREPGRTAINFPMWVRTTPCHTIPRTIILTSRHGITRLVAHHYANDHGHIARVDRY